MHTVLHTTLSVKCFPLTFGEKEWTALLLYIASISQSDRQYEERGGDRQKKQAVCLCTAVLWIREK